MEEVAGVEASSGSVWSARPKCLDAVPQAVTARRTCEHKGGGSVAGCQGGDSGSGAQSRLVEPGKRQGTEGFSRLQQPGQVLWSEVLLSADPDWRAGLGPAVAAAGHWIARSGPERGSDLCPPGYPGDSASPDSWGKGRSLHQLKCFSQWRLAATCRTLVQHSIRFLKLSSLIK
jgi:hypothetical protein